MPACLYTPTRVEKKALLVGISYNRERGGKWDPIPTSIPNVKKIEGFLKGERPLLPSIFVRSHHTLMPLGKCGYGDIVILTDEDGVEERYWPTKTNLVRPLPGSHPGSTYLNNTFLQEREIDVLCRGVEPGDRRVFYCMSLPSRHSPPPALTLPPTTRRRSFTPEILHDR